MKGGGGRQRGRGRETGREGKEGREGREVLALDTSLNGLLLSLKFNLSPVS